MPSKIEIYVDGELFRLPRVLLSRTVWLTFLLAALNFYQEIGDPAVFFAQFGIVFSDDWMHAINTAGLLLAAYFRISQKQPLGAGGKIEHLKPEELDRLRNVIRAELASETAVEVKP